MKKIGDRPTDVFVDPSGPLKRVVKQVFFMTDYETLRQIMKTVREGKASWIEHIKTHDGVRQR